MEEKMPIKSPFDQCQCPPYKECVIDFKPDEDMNELIKIRGNSVDLREINNKLHKVKRTSETKAIMIDDNAKAAMLRSRLGRETRRNNECCCPPRNYMLPTFITDKKFKEFKKKLQARH